MRRRIQAPEPPEEYIYNAFETLLGSSYPNLVQSFSYIRGILDRTLQLLPTVENIQLLGQIRNDMNDIINIFYSFITSDSMLDYMENCIVPDVARDSGANIYNSLINLEQMLPEMIGNLQMQLPNLRLFDLK